MKILTIEDDMFFQKFYSGKLIEAGYEVEVAVDGNDGLAKMVSAKPDLVLLDMIMPNKDGFEVLEAVSQNAELKKIPIIVFSTLGDKSDVQRALDLGAVDYINKSFHDIETLKTKINAHLGRTPVTQQPAPQPVQQQVAQPVQQHPSQVPAPTVGHVQPAAPVQSTQPTQQTQQPNPSPQVPTKSDPNGNTTGST